MQGNYRCLTPNPHQGWCGLFLKSQDKKQGSQRELDNIASLLLLWRLWSSDLRLGFSWGLVGQLCPLRYFPVLGMESFFAQALTVCLPAKTVLPLRAPSLFLTTGAKPQPCLPASECGQRGHTRAVSEHGATCLGLVMRKWLPPLAVFYNWAVLGSLSLRTQFNFECFGLILSFECLYKLQHLVMIVCLFWKGKH